MRHHLSQGHLHTVQPGDPADAKTSLNTHTSPRSPAAHKAAHGGRLARHSTREGGLQEEWTGGRPSCGSRRSPSGLSGATRGGNPPPQQGSLGTSHQGAARPHGEGPAPIMPKTVSAPDQTKTPPPRGLGANVTTEGQEASSRRPEEEGKCPASHSVYLSTFLLPSVTPAFRLASQKQRSTYVSLPVVPQRAMDRTEHGRESCSLLQRWRGPEEAAWAVRARAVPAGASPGAEPAGVMGSQTINLSFLGGNSSPCSGGKGWGWHHVPDSTGLGLAVFAGAGSAHLLP